MPCPLTPPAPVSCETDEHSTPPATNTRLERRYPARELKKAQTRERLMDAAVLCFSRNGFDSTTPEEISRMAGITRSTFYLHFKSTAELALCLGRSLEDESVSLLRELDCLKAPTVEQIRAWLHRIIELYRSRFHIVTALNRALSSSPKWEAHYAEFANFFPRGMTRYLSRYEGEAREEAHRRIVLFYMLVERFLYFEVLVQTPLHSSGMDRTMAEGIHQLLYAGRPEHGIPAASRADVVSAR